MKKIISFVAAGVIASAMDISTLLNALKKIPDTKIDFANVKEMKANKKEVVSAMYPKVTILANAVHYSNPYNLRPMPPTESHKIAMKGGGYWFSQNIQRIGFEASVPLFIKSIYDNKKKIQHLLNAVKYKAKLNLLQRQAMLITYVSSLNYLYDLKKALLQKQKSIQETRNAIAVGVKVGRIPEFKLLRLDDALNQIKIKIKEIDINIQKTKADIYKLTMINIDSPVEFHIVRSINQKEFYALKPLNEQLKASDYSIKAAKDSFWPKVVVKIEGMRNFGRAYDNNKQLALNFASAGIYVSWDIFDKKSNAQIQKAKIQAFKSSLMIQKTLKDLKAAVNQIRENLKEIKSSITLAKESLQLKKELLKSAKKAFELNTMTVDEYLQYEDDVAMAKANLASLEAKKYALFANLAFIYGNNFERIFK